MKGPALKRTFFGLLVAAAAVAVLGAACPKPAVGPAPVPAAAAQDRDFNDPADPADVCPDIPDAGVGSNGCPDVDAGARRHTSKSGADARPGQAR